MRLVRKHEEGLGIMHSRKSVIGLTAAVAGVGMALPTGSPAMARAVPAVAPVSVRAAVSSARSIPIGLLARDEVSSDADPGRELAYTTYPATFDFTNNTPYTLHIKPESQSGDECWDNPGKPDVKLAPGQTSGGRAWTQERHRHCYINFRVSIVAPDGKEWPIKPSQSYYQGREEDSLSTMTFYFPQEPDGDNWMWALWGYYALPSVSAGVDTSKQSALYFRVSDQNGKQDKCRDKNGSEIYCHVTIGMQGPGAQRPKELFPKGDATARRRKVKAEPKSWPTIAAIEGMGCRLRGIDEKRCDKTDGSTTNFTGLTVAEKNFSLDTKGISIVGDIVDSGTWANNADSVQTYAFDRSVTTGEDSSSTSTHSHSVGGSLSFEVTSKVGTEVAAFEKKFSVTVNTEHKWEYSETKTTSKAETKSNHYSMQIPKRSKVDWRVVQNAVTSTTSKYTADVLIGPDKDEREPITSPLFSSALISPTDHQPCLAIAIGGDAVPYSLLWLRKYIQQNGTQYGEAEKKMFLDSAANFTVSGQCPGMPVGFPSRAAFKGEGYVIDRQRGMTAACTFVTPLKKSGPSDEPPSGGVEPPPEAPAGEQNTIDNTPPKCDGPKQGRAVAFDASMTPFTDQDTIEGTEYGDLMMTKDRTGVTLLGGDSRDIIEGGVGAGNVLNGQTGDDIITGGDAGELIRGGAGSDNINAGKGADKVIDTAGDGNVLNGGPGSDRLIGANGRTSLLGGKGKDVLVARGAQVMDGGPGADTYILRSGAKGASVTEALSKDRDIVQSWRSFTLPGGIEVLELKGKKALTATGTWGDQTLIGNKGNNVLTGGAGFDTLVGGKGNDKIYLSTWGLNTITGGPGKDRFILSGEPTAVDAQGRKGAPGSSHVIKDFMPGKDKLVLTSKVHGPEVKQLRKVFRVFDPTSMSASDLKAGSGPALVINPKTGVVRYDRDDAGLSPERVLVRLPKGVMLTAKDVQIR